MTYIKILLSVYYNFFIISPQKLIAFIAFTIVSQLGFFIALKLTAEVILTHGLNQITMQVIAYIVLCLMFFLFGQFMSKSLVVTGLSEVEKAFRDKISINLARGKKRNVGFIAPILVESRQLLLAVPRFVIAIILVSFIFSNLLIILSVPAVVLLYFQSAIKIEAKMKPNFSLPVWRRLRMQNKYELIFSMTAILICISAIFLMNTELKDGDFVLIILSFRIIISELSNVGYGLPRQVRYIKSLPSWPVFFSEVRSWKL